MFLCNIVANILLFVTKYNIKKIQSLWKNTYLWFVFFFYVWAVSYEIDTYINLSSEQAGYNAAVRNSLITKKPYNIQNRFWHKNVKKRVLSIILV